VDGRWTLVEALWDRGNPRQPRGGGSDRREPLELERYLREVWAASVKLKLTISTSGSRRAAEKQQSIKRVRAPRPMDLREACSD
jgi:hypothetical protein